jgi:hypothetical protein
LHLAARLLGHEGEMAFADGDLDPESGVHRAQRVGVSDGLGDVTAREVFDVAVAEREVGPLVDFPDAVR